MGRSTQTPCSCRVRPCKGCGALQQPRRGRRPKPGRHACRAGRGRLAMSASPPGEPAAAPAPASALGQGAAAGAPSAAPAPPAPATVPEQGPAPAPGPAAPPASAREQGSGVVAVQPGAAAAAPSASASPPRGRPAAPRSPASPGRPAPPAPAAPAAARAALRPRAPPPPPQAAPASPRPAGYAARAAAACSTGSRLPAPAPAAPGGATGVLTLWPPLPAAYLHALAPPLPRSPRKLRGSPARATPAPAPAWTPQRTCAPARSRISPGRHDAGALAAAAPAATYGAPKGLAPAGDPQPRRLGLELGSDQTLLTVGPDACPAAAEPSCSAAGARVTSAMAPTPCYADADSAVPCPWPGPPPAAPSRSGRDRAAGERSAELPPAPQRRRRLWLRALFCLGRGRAQQRGGHACDAPSRAAAASAGGGSPAAVWPALAPPAAAPAAGAGGAQELARPGDASSQAHASARPPPDAQAPRSAPRSTPQESPAAAGAAYRGAADAALRLFAGPRSDGVAPPQRADAGGAGTARGPGRPGGSQGAPGPRVRHTAVTLVELLVRAVCSPARGSPAAAARLPAAPAGAAPRAVRGSHQGHLSRPHCLPWMPASLPIDHHSPGWNVCLGSV